MYSIPNLIPLNLSTEVLVKTGNCTKMLLCAIRVSLMSKFVMKSAFFLDWKHLKKDTIVMYPFGTFSWIILNQIKCGVEHVKRFWDDLSVHTTIKVINSEQDYWIPQWLFQTNKQQHIQKNKVLRTGAFDEMVGSDLMLKCVPGWRVARTARTWVWVFDYVQKTMELVGLWAQNELGSYWIAMN